MSIFADAVSIDADDHADGCARWVPLFPGETAPGRWMSTGRTRFRYEPDAPCTCNAGPLRYDASHIVPDGDGARSGFVTFSEIPRFDGDGDCPSACGCCDRLWPFLRLWVWDGRVSGSKFVGSPVVLDQTQVGRIHGYLGRWLQRAGEPG